MIINESSQVNVAPKSAGDGWLLEGADAFRGFPSVPTAVGGVATGEIVEVSVADYLSLFDLPV